MLPPLALNAPLHLMQYLPAVPLFRVNRQHLQFSLRVICRFSTGTFYFAAIGGSHVAVTTPSRVCSLRTRTPPKPNPGCARATYSETIHLDVLRPSCTSGADEEAGFGDRISQASDLLSPASPLPKMEFPTSRKLGAGFVKSFPTGRKLRKNSVDNLRGL